MQWAPDKKSKIKIMNRKSIKKTIDIIIINTLFVKDKIEGDKNNSNDQTFCRQNWKRES